MRAARFLLAMLAALAASGQALAASACPGTVTATSVSPIPLGALMAVVTPTEDSVSKAVRDLTFLLLRRAGYSIGTPPSFVLTWRGGSGASNTAVSRTDPFAMRDRGTSSTDDLSWMQGTTTAGSFGLAPVERLNGTLELREFGTRQLVWTATFSCARIGRERGPVIATIVGSVVPLIGKTARGKEF